MLKQKNILENNVNPYASEDLVANTWKDVEDVKRLEDKKEKDSMRRYLQSQMQDAAIGDIAEKMALETSIDA